MESYKRKLKLRLAWWWVWWAICAFMFFGNLLELIMIIVDYMFISHESPDTVYVITKVVALIIFIIPTFAFFPSVDRLLAKDLTKNKDNLYAKAISLERRLAKKNKIADEMRKDKEIEKTVEEMEQELANDRKAQSP